MLSKGINQGLVHIGDRPRRPTEVEGTIGFGTPAGTIYQTCKELRILSHLMLDVYFGIGVTTECKPDVRKDSVFDVCFDFLAIQIFLRTVSGAKIIDHRPYGDALAFQQASVLNEGTERGCACPEPSHNNGLEVRGWQLQNLH